MILVLLAGGASFLLTFVLIPPFISFLTKGKILQQVREEGPATHKVKSATPTMGGIVILAATTTIFLAATAFSSLPSVEKVVRLPSPSVSERLPILLFLLLAFLGNGAIGLADDLTMVRHGRSLGLKARHKLLLQLILTAALLTIFVRYCTPLYTGTILPFFHEVKFGWIFFPLFFLVFFATPNAVNLTDGLDGLAAGTVLIASIFFFVVSASLNEWLLTLFLGILAGSLLAFLWYNCYPARIFMGDSGSLALGGALAASAFVTRTPFWLLLVGGVFVVEALSVIIQVAYFKSTGGKRIFKMSPLHHHYETSGVPEPQVTARFWIAQALLLGIALILLFLTTPPMGRV